ncbi:MAG: thiamine pyrophosphate-binding protein [Candidatus Dormibacteria bacterium]
MTPPALADRRAAVYEALISGLREAGVSFAVSLPDDWVAPLCQALDTTPGMTHVRVAREPEIIGMCCGSFFGGVRAVGVMGATGFLACVSEIATLSRRYQIPLVLVVSQRGSLHDHQVFQEVQGRVIGPVANALGLPSLVLDSIDKLALVPAAVETSRLQKRPVVLWLSKALLTERAPLSNPG